MKKVITTVVAVGALALVAGSAQAQDWSLFLGNYTDVVPYANSVGGVSTPNVGPNTWADPVSTAPPARITSYESDGAATAGINGYRLRSGGTPGTGAGGGSGAAFNNDLYYTSDAYSGVQFDGLQSYTRITGLSANTVYTIAAYGIIGGNKDTLQFTFDGGSSWTMVYDEPVIMNPLAGSDWLVASTTDAIGTPTGTLARSGDTRFRVIIGDMMTDGSGNLTVGFRDPGYRSTSTSILNPATSDRGRIDGFAVAEGSVLIVPEPTTFALAGLGAAALLIFRRRS